MKINNIMHGTLFLVMKKRTYTYWDYGDTTTFQLLQNRIDLSDNLSFAARRWRSQTSQMRSVPNVRAVISLAIHCRVTVATRRGHDSCTYTYTQSIVKRRFMSSLARVVYFLSEYRTSGTRIRHMYFLTLVEAIALHRRRPSPLLVTINNNYLYGHNVYEFRTRA